MISNSTVEFKTLKKYAAAALAFGAVVFAHPSHAEESASDGFSCNEASSLDELLENVKARRVVESRENAARERRFANEKAARRVCLKKLKTSVCVSSGDLIA